MPPSAPVDPVTAADDVLRLAREECGFALVGIADARASEHADFVRRWIAAGRHGEMHYLANHLDVRLDPGNLQEGAVSIIAVGDAYCANSEERSEKSEDLAIGRSRSSLFLVPSSSPSPHGKIARYAWGDDYHKVLKGRLHRLADLLNERYPGYAFRTTVDTAPALEREHAARAGLGWQGKNTMMIHPRHGSYMLLGLIVTSLPLRPSRDAPATAEPAPHPLPGIDHCGTCTRCIDACPTQCITSDPAPGSPDPGRGRSIDATRCISYLTLEHRSEIDPALHPLMGDWIAGCDVCQEVCPFNRVQAPAWPLPIHPRYRPRPEFAGGLPLLDVLGWTEDDRRRAFTASALKRVKLDMLKRNALIAAGNRLAAGDDPPLRERVAAIAADESQPPLVRATAAQVLARLAADRRFPSPEWTPGDEALE